MLASFDCQHAVVSLVTGSITFILYVETVPRFRAVHLKPAHFPPSETDCHCQQLSLCSPTSGCASCLPHYSRVVLMLAVCIPHIARMRSTISSRPLQRSHSRSPSKALAPKTSLSKQTSAQPSAVSRHTSLFSQATATPLSPASRARLLHSLHLQHNGRLLMAVEREEQREQRREALLAATTDAGERWRLEGSFGLERGEAAERLTTLSSQCEREMALTMEQLGMIGGWDSGHTYSGEWEEKRQLSAKKKQQSKGSANGRVRVG